MENSYVNNFGVASRLVRVHELADLPPNTKVRFLGCVIQYDLDNGLLCLHEPSHVHSDKSEHTAQIIAGIDISMVDTKTSQISTGSWINVIGYIDHPKYKPMNDGDKVFQGVKIRAQALWDAGSIDTNEYFDAVSRRRAAFNA